MEYTIENIPPNLDEALQARARKEGKSLDEVILEALLKGLGLSEEPTRRRDLSDIAGTSTAEPEAVEAPYRWPDLSVDGEGLAPGLEDGGWEALRDRISARNRD